MRKSDSGVVMRMSAGCFDHRRPLLGGRVAGAHRDRELRADARERASEVALDVVVERLQGADVEDLDPFTGPGLVERPEERGQGLARAGRCLDQRVLAGGDRRPALLLGRRGSVERALEPPANLLAEGRESVHASAYRAG